MSRSRKTQKISPQLADDSRFFHRKNVVAGIWAVVATLIATPITYFATRGYENTDAPKRVIVANQDTTVRMVFRGDTAEAKYLAQLVNEVQALRSDQRRTQQPGSSSASSLKASAAKQPPNSAASDSLALALPAATAFKFPQRVSGYVQSSLALLAGVTCPDRMAAQGAEVMAEVRMNNSSMLQRLTPLFTSLVRRRSETSVDLVASLQLEATASTRVRIALPTEPGQYEIDLGFYLKSDTASEYPTFYVRRCLIQVH